MTLDHAQMISLSPRERICLYWAAMGKTAEETACILQLKPLTVVAYRRSIRDKLNCVSLPQAIYKGMQLGYLT